MYFLAFILLIKSHAMTLAFSFETYMNQIFQMRYRTQFLLDL